MKGCRGPRKASDLNTRSTGQNPAGVDPDGSRVLLKSIPEFVDSEFQPKKGINVDTLKISFMEKSDIQESAKVLSTGMLNNPLHVAIFQGEGEKERIEIEKMFYNLLVEWPGIVFLAKEGQKIIGVMRMKSCDGSKITDDPKESAVENGLDWRKSLLFREWARNDPLDQHWHLGPIGVLPSYQGLGIGSELMHRFCREVDICLAKAYLETDLDKNVRFYEKFGFKTVSESKILNVNNWYMVRAKKHEF
jgi:ribosomal protein S18 acetylase RimI-like enzyme